RRREPGFRKHPAAAFEETRTAAEAIGDTVSPDELRRLFTLLGHEKILIVILDEFDRVEDARVRRAVADTIKSFSDHSVLATIIIVGVAETADDLIAEHQSIERVLVQVQMPRMQPGDMVEILEKGTARLHMTIDEGAARFIASLSQGLPYYT